MKWWWIATLMLGLGGAGTADSQPAAVQKLTLGNGLTVLLAPDPQATAVDVALWYGAAPRFEKRGTSGITHLFERLMSRGASSRMGAGEYARIVQVSGGAWNTYTTPDYTSFYQTVPEQALEQVLEVEAGRMSALRFTAADLESERQAVREERRHLVEGSPIGRALEKLYATAYPDHPYGWPVIGLERDVEAITLADAETYYRERYAPNNAVLTVVGHFDPGPTLAAVKRAFGPIKRRGAAPRPSAPPSAPKAERRGWERMSGPAAVVLVGWRGPSDSDPDSPALTLLAEAVAGGPAARLNRVLAARDQKYLYLQSGYDARKDASLLYCLAVVPAGGDTAAVERELVSEVEKLATQALSQEEIERAERRSEVRLLFDSQTTRGRALSLGSAHLVAGDFREAERRPGRMRQMTASDLTRAAARVLGPASRTVVWMTPSGEGQP